MTQGPATASELAVFVGFADVCRSLAVFLNAIADDTMAEAALRAKEKTT